MLDKLPRDIWSCILQYHCFVGTLWTCGNRALHLRLSSAVESVTLIHIPVGKFRLPSWVMELSNLKHFELRSHATWGRGLGKWFDMSKRLPNTLESLTIHPQDACNSFAEWATQIDDLSADCYQLTSAFPNLKSLVLKGAHFAESVEFFSVLPPTLASLDVGSHNQSLVHFSKLPRSLTYLAANPFIGTTDATLPDLLNDLAQSPPGIIVTQMTLSTEKASATVHLLPKLPSNLISLTLNHYLPSMVSLLPRSLVKLDLGINQGTRYTSLASNTAEASTSSLSMNWPPTLQELKATFVSALATLPRNLLRLNMLLSIDVTALHIPFYADELPQHLQALTISVGNSHILRFHGNLPSTLTHLSMSDLYAHSLDFSASLPIENLSFTLLPFGIRTRTTSGFTFPPNLTKLHASRWRAEWMSEIPPQVTNLHIVTLDNTSTNYDLFSSLPKGLVSFTSEKLSSVPLVASFKRSQLPSLLYLTLLTLELTPSSIEYLPRTLKTLTVVVGGLSRKSDLSFLGDLPPHLEKCQVFPNGYQPDKIEEYWPPALWRCLLVDKDNWSKIPRLLERLALGPPPPSSDWIASFEDSMFD